jgi:hypothetical protein
MFEATDDQGEDGQNECCNLQASNHGWRLSVDCGEDTGNACDVSSQQDTSAKVPRGLK